MKKLIIVLLFVFTSLSFAQDLSEAIRSFNSLAQGQFRRYENQDEVVKKINALALNITNSLGIEVEKVLFSGKEALKISPSYASIINKEALRVEREFGGMALIFSVYHLKRGGSNAFFNPDGTMIGVPRDFIVGKLSESYLHELGHAKTFQNIILNDEEKYAGVFKAHAGFQLSKLHSGGYARFSSLDEFKTTLYSASLSMKELFAIYQKSPDKKEFYRNDHNEEILSSILFSLETGIGLSKQVRDLCERAMIELNQNNVSIETFDLKIGQRLSKRVNTFIFRLDSFSPETAGRYTVHSKGSELKFYSLSTNKSKMLKRLKELVLEAKELETEAISIKKTIGLRIMYADLATTNIPKLASELINRFNF